MTCACDLFELSLLISFVLSKLETTKGHCAKAYLRITQRKEHDDGVQVEPSERELRAGFHHYSSKHTCVRSSANPAKGWGQRARPLSRKSLLWSASLLQRLTETHEAARKGKSSTQSLRVWLCPMFLRFRRVAILVHHTSATRGSTKCRAGERVPSCGLAPGVHHTPLVCNGNDALRWLLCDRIRWWH